MQKEDIKRLLKKYNTGNCSAEEKAFVEDWYLQFEHHLLEDLSEQQRENDLHKIWNALPVHQERNNTIHLWSKIAAAAIVTIMLSAGGYFLLSDQKSSYAQTADIQPGGNKALLTLANGKHIELSGAKDGKITYQDSSVIKKNSNGQLVYQLGTASEAVSPAGLNTVETPPGGQYQVILSDGTKVWLNAASSLTFPTAFAGKERKVTLSGEGYFEVAKNKAMPFKVENAAQEIEVLGTHFNVSAYVDDHLTRTTLLEGSILLNHQTLLKPGEQAVNSETGISIQHTDTENAVAWKNGKFKFTNENITDLMRKVARWYNVEIVYDGPMTHKDFSGSVSRFDHISKILDLLESTNTVHFKVQGRRITVMP
jgi:transmembrane sensor